MVIAYRTCGVSLIVVYRSLCGGDISNSRAKAGQKLGENCILAYNEKLAINGGNQGRRLYAANITSHPSHAIYAITLLLQWCCSDIAERSGAVPLHCVPATLSMHNVRICTMFSIVHIVLSYCISW